MPEPAPLNRHSGPGGADAAEASQGLLTAAIAREDAERDRLAAALHGVDLATLHGDAARIAFWANVYNALLLHARARRPIEGSLLRHRRLFRQASYAIAGQRWSLDVIEHGVLRRNARPPLRLRPLLRRGDPRRRAAPTRLDPRVHFALNCGARSCPPVRVYSPETLDTDLEDATRAYLRAETVVHRQRGEVELPGLCRLYARDFGSRAALVDFAAVRLDVPAADILRRTEPRRLRFASFDWTLVEAR